MHEGVNDAAETQVLCPGLCNDGGDVVAVSELRGCAGGVGEQFRGECRDDAFLVLEQQRLVFRDVCKGASIRHAVAAFHSRPAVYAAVVESLEGDGRTGGFGHAVVVAPAADDIEGFQCKARRIHDRLAAHARGSAAMFCELLVDGRCPANVWLALLHVVRRVLWRDAQNALIQPFAADNWGGFGAVSGLGVKASALAVLLPWSFHGCALPNRPQTCVP